MAALLGLVPGRNALDVYHSYTRPQPPPGPDNIHTFRGKGMERELIPEWYRRKSGRGARRYSGAATHPKFPAFQCHLDLDIFSDPEHEVEEMRGPGVGEIKAPSAPVIRRIVEEGIREAEVVQLETYCAVVRRAHGSFVLGSYESEHAYDPETDTAVIIVEHVARPKLGAFLLETGQRFWDDHVVPRVPPDPGEWLLWNDPRAPQVYRTTGDRLTIEDPRAEAMAREVLEARDLKKRGEELYDERLDVFKAWLETHAESDRVLISPGLGNWTVVRNAGRESLSRDAIVGHRPIDRDKFFHWLSERAERLGLDGDPEAIEEVLAGLDLDVGMFVRRGEPYSFLLPPRGGYEL
jgi:hypothetical protein